MEKIRQTKRPRRRMGVRLLACAALAAVFTVSAMAAYHLWGPGELFDPFFTLESAPLDGGQKELLDQIGVTDLILCPREPEDAGETYREGEWSVSLDSFYQGKINY